MKVTDKGQIIIPPDLRMLPRREVEFVDQPDGVVVVKVGKLIRGKRVLATLPRGGKIKGRADDWLLLTRGGTSSPAAPSASENRQPPEATQHSRPPQRETPAVVSRRLACLAG